MGHLANQGFAFVTFCSKLGVTSHFLEQKIAKDTKMQVSMAEEISPFHGSVPAMNGP